MLILTRVVLVVCVLDQLGAFVEDGLCQHIGGQCLFNPRHGHQVDIASQAAMYREGISMLASDGAQRVDELLVKLVAFLGAVHYQPPTGVKPR